jgi:hypothetical protein
MATADSKKGWEVLSSSRERHELGLCGKTLNILNCNKIHEIINLLREKYYFDS